MALAAVLVLGACRADGGGSSVSRCREARSVSIEGDAEFGFNFTCEMERKDRPRAVIRGEITYHDSPGSSPSRGLADLFPEIRLTRHREP